MPLALAVVVQPCTEHVHVHARGVSDISSGHARTRAKVGRVLVFYSFYEENQAELKQPERLETRGCGSLLFAIGREVWRLVVPTQPRH